MEVSTRKCHLPTTAAACTGDVRRRKHARKVDDELMVGVVQSRRLYTVEGALTLSKSFSISICRKCASRVTVKLVATHVLILV